jgi:hypothetical protein
MRGCNLFVAKVYTCPKSQIHGIVEMKECGKTEDKRRTKTKRKRKRKSEEVKENPFHWQQEAELEFQ